MNFRITGLAAEDFRHLFGLPDHELEKLAIKRYIADKKPGFPDRVELKDVDIGKPVLLLNHMCQPALNPYRASHAIFIREGAERTYDAVNQIPDSLRTRLLSLRAYDSNDMMIDAHVVDGSVAEPVIEQIFRNPDVSYIHAHNAKQGCYAARIDRA